MEVRGRDALAIGEVEQTGGVEPDAVGFLAYGVVVGLRAYRGLIVEVVELGGVGRCDGRQRGNHPTGRWVCCESSPCVLSPRLRGTGCGVSARVLERLSVGTKKRWYYGRLAPFSVWSLWTGWSSFCAFVASMTEAGKYRNRNLLHRSEALSSGFTRFGVVVAGYCKRAPCRREKWHRFARCGRRAVVAAWTATAEWGPRSSRPAELRCDWAGGTKAGFRRLRWTGARGDR